MKKLILLLALVIGSCTWCMAIDRTTENSTENLLACLKLSPGIATPDAVTNVLGRPANVEESKKRTLWKYTRDNSMLTISWNNRSDELEKFSFTCEPKEKTTFDARISGRLRSGSTDIMQAVKILGIPSDMTIKAVTQEMHYAYSNSVLRLFFRNGMLVDYTLQGRF